MLKGNVFFFLLLVWIFQNLKEFKSELLLMSVLIRFCLIESFNIKVGKGNVLMRNLKVLVGTEDFLQIRINVSSVFTFNKLCVIFCRHIVDYSLSTLYIFVIQFLNLDIYHPLFSFYFRKTVWFLYNAVCVCDHGTFISRYR